MIKYLVVFAIFIAVLGFVYIRLIPFDAARFHKAAFPASAGDYPGTKSFIAIREITASSADVLKAFDIVAQKTPRTTLMAGLPDLSLVTYQTRSLLFGFPDYTTVSVIKAGTVGNDNTMIAIRGRARFGMSDLSVNQKRIEGWLDQLGPLTVAP